jgi:hypothetical protein
MAERAEVAPEAFVPSSTSVATGQDSVPFDELVLARFNAISAETQHRPDAEAQRELYKAVRRRFQLSEGRIVESFWSSACAAGIALTRKRRFLVLGTRTKFHRWTELATAQYPQVAAELYRGDNLAHRCEEVLRGSTQRIGLGRVFGAMSSLVSFIEVQKAHELQSVATSDRQGASELDGAIAAYRADLDEAAVYYQASAARAAHIFYSFGMLLGVVSIAALTTGIVFVVNYLLDKYGIFVSSDTYAVAIATVSAGALGACVSTMWRISSGNFQSDYEAGSGHIRMLGAFRPFIGAIFGLALYFAIKAGILPLDKDANFYSIAFVAFLGGFSERFAPDVFGGATSGIQGGRGPVEPTPPDLADQRRTAAEVLPSAAWKGSDIPPESS